MCMRIFRDTINVVVNMKYFWRYFQLYIPIGGVCIYIICSHAGGANRLFTLDGSGSQPFRDYCSHKSDWSKLWLEIF